MSVRLQLQLALLCACSVLATPFPIPQSVLQLCARSAVTLQPWVTGARRYLHRIPELARHEYKTSAYIQAALKELNVSYQTGFGIDTAVVATIGSGKPVVALRADMDALPIQEPEGVDFRSTHPGRMHACGHDAHTAMLLGAAKLLQHQQALLPDGLPGTVKLVFQPDEEYGAGGDVIIKHGALDGVEAAFALHVMPHLPSGVVATRKGTIMAGAMSFKVVVQGRGGHAAMPHANIDPVVAASAVLSALQTLISRETSPLASGVISVTTVRAGDAFNVIPDEAMLGGTIRALGPEQMDFLRSRVEDVAVKVAKAYSCNASVDFMLDEQPLYPPTVNDAGAAKLVEAVATGLFGGRVFEEAEPLMTAEDFAFYCRKVPCALAFLGIHNETAGSTHALHNSRFTLDESVLYKGAALHTAWALAYLGVHAQGSQGASGNHKHEL